jgi:acetylornithine deacetylase/succinyl-diaminopimelate desuccinylase-like protein
VRPRTTDRLPLPFPLIALLALTACHPLPAPLPPGGSTIYDEAVLLLRRYLAIDTTNPPGHERRTALFLKAVLDREGIESTIIDLGGDRANLHAVLRGDGTKGGVVLNHHMDVVPAEATHWTLPPFGGQMRAGEIYGRGAVDIKGKGIIDLMTMIHLKRLGRRLTRDIIFLAVADEEVSSIGARHIVERRPELLRGAEFLLDEGANVHLDERGRLLGYVVSIGEKTPLWLTVTFRGRPGHGAIPLADSAVNRAVRAAHRILARPAEPVLLPELRSWLRLQLRGRDLTRLAGYTGDLERSLDNPAFLRELAKDEALASALSNTIAITGLRAGDKINSIPNEASIQLDCRLLPGVDPRRFISELRHVIADPSAQVTLAEALPPGRPSRSPADSELTRALQRCAQRRDPGSSIVPTILLSSTDAVLFRQMGIKTYGFEPYRLTDETERSHGNDERLSVANVRFGIDLLTELLQELGTPR